VTPSHLPLEPNDLLAIEGGALLREHDLEGDVEEKVAKLVT
jgi:hypothetical protein